MEHTVADALRRPSPVCDADVESEPQSRELRYAVTITCESALDRPLRTCNAAFIASLKRACIALLSCLWCSNTMCIYKIRSQALHTCIRVRVVPV
jgi:hypothetical protein